MPPRIRTKTSSITGVVERYDRGTLVNTTARTRTSHSTCTDVSGNYGRDNPFHIDRYQASGSIISGKNLSGQGTGTIAMDFPASRPVSSTLPLYAAYSGVNATNSLLAATGPLTPKVNLPLSIFELKDIPQMLKHAGDYLLRLRKVPLGGLRQNDKELASWTLAFQFGWKPLIEDILKLLDFSEHVAKRQTELEKAHSSRGLKRRLTIFSDENQYTSNIALETGFGFGATVACTIKQTIKVWGTVRWHVQDGQNNTGRKPTYMDAFRAALGFNRGQLSVTVWKAIPWTWMIDWFSNISQVLQANYNMIYYKPTSACIMQHRVTTLKHEPYPKTNPYLSKGDHIREDLSRTVAALPKTKVRLNVPFLDSFKLSILGSLTILRIRGR